MITLKDVINILVRKTAMALFHIFYIFPVHDNRIMFESFEGRSYSCNPKYICEYLLHNKKDRYELIWSFKERNTINLPTGIISVKKNSIRFMFYRFTSRLIISNMTDPIYLPKRKNQLILCTWHAGGAYKRVGNSYTLNDTYRKKWQMGQLREKTDIWLSSSELFTRYNIFDAYNFHGEILKCGMPRNDLFFSNDKIKLAARKVVDYYHLEDFFIVLYAPTYRDKSINSIQQEYDFPQDIAIEELRNVTNRKVAFLYRGHYYSKVSSQTSKDNDEIVLNVSDYPDMQELLAAADVLITDYSSSMWDFALTGKPCILWVPDKKIYADERGTYTPIDTWPGVICETVADLLKTIGTLKTIDFETIYKKHFSDFNSYETGNAAETVCSYIYRKCSKKI